VVSGSRADHPVAGTRQVARKPVPIFFIKWRRLQLPMFLSAFQHIELDSAINPKLLEIKRQKSYLNAEMDGRIRGQAINESSTYRY
jgi:hypothetical protein